MIHMKKGIPARLFLCLSFFLSQEFAEYSVIHAMGKYAKYAKHYRHDWEKEVMFKGK